MWIFPEFFQVIVIGAGHAGCEAAHAAARMGCTTLLLTMNLDTIGKMSCNPAVGGTAKGHLVREIDALGGIMGKVTDGAAVQYRMLNKSKGAAVWSPRAQVDKLIYQREMRSVLEKTANLLIKQAVIDRLLFDSNKILGVETEEGIAYMGATVVLTTGTFIDGLIHIGEKSLQGGRLGDPSSIGIGASLKEIGFKMGRMKTGTPPRVQRRSVDLSLLEEQWGEEEISFSFDPLKTKRLEQLPCYITYTSQATREIVIENLHRSPLYSGKIRSIGPRYCPSIEDKYVRFPDKDRHLVFVEPETSSTDELYLNGISTSLPYDLQIKMVQTLPGFSQAQLTRPAYAIEYDYLSSGQLKYSLESRRLEALFFAGQINGTTGYEEAAAQGLMAGINAALQVQGKEAFILKRADAYIGVMIDELMTRTLEEPYRIFTSSAEYRLLLRQDNADLRLRAKGYQLALIDQLQMERLGKKAKIIEEQILYLSNRYVPGQHLSFAQLLSRPTVSYKQLQIEFPNLILDYGKEIHLQLELQIKYAGYVQRQEREVSRLESIETVAIPPNFNYQLVSGLSREAKEKWSKSQPENVGQAYRLLGITAADIQILLIALRYNKAGLR